MKSRPGEKERARRTVESFGCRHRFSERLRQSIDLTLEELLTNIVVYGRAKDHEPRITIRLAVKKDAVQIEVEDDALPFNPLEYPPVDTSIPLDEKPVGGLGIQIIRKMMDRLEYHRRGDKNVLLMETRLE